MTFDNFTIRPITTEDAVAFFQLVESNKHRISTYFPGIVTKTTTLEETKSHIAERLAGASRGKYMIHLIIDNLTNAIAGVIQLKDIDTNAKKREFGFFVDSKYERKGIATKSILLALDHCFNSLDLNKIFMRIAEENTASRRVAEKCGFTVEGVLRDDFTTSEGKLINLFYYGLLKKEFENKQIGEKGQ
jgi:RimJ/RimL family protein N-acetyltransferase